MSGLMTLIRTLEVAGVRGQLWIDGSFVTQKINSDDVDVVLRVSSEFYDKGTLVQRAAIDWLAANQKKPLKCDSYVFFEYPPGDPLHSYGVGMRDYWRDQWSSDHAGRPKGFVVCELGEIIVSERASMHSFFDWERKHHDDTFLTPPSQRLGCDG